MSVLALASSASAADVTVYISSMYMQAGYVVSGTVASLQTVDSNVLTMRETNVTVGALIFTQMPNSDNTTLAWGSTCGSYWPCVDDVSPDYNGTIVWTIQPGDFSILTLGFENWEFPQYVITEVYIGVLVRKNNTGASSFRAKLYDSYTSTYCGVDIDTTGLLNSFSFLAGTHDTTCGGETWTGTVLNRTEIQLDTNGTSNPVTVSTIYLNVLAQTQIHYLDARFNATLTSTQTPQSVNWTCNRTSADTYALYAFRYSPGTPNWQVITAPICSVGAQASSGVAYPSGTFRDSGGISRLRLTSAGNNFGVSGNILFDRLVIITNDTAPPPPIATSEDYSWVVFIFISVATTIFLAWRVKKWRER